MPLSALLPQGPAAKAVVRAPHKLQKKGKKEKMRRIAKQQAPQARPAPALANVLQEGGPAADGPPCLTNRSG